MSDPELSHAATRMLASLRAVTQPQDAVGAWRVVETDAAASHLQSELSCRLSSAAIAQAIADLSEAGVYRSTSIPEVGLVLYGQEAAPAPKDAPQPPQLAPTLTEAIAAVSVALVAVYGPQRSPDAPAAPKPLRVFGSSFLIRDANRKQTYGARALRFPDKIMFCVSDDGVHGAGVFPVTPDMLRDYSLRALVEQRVTTHDYISMVVSQFEKEWSKHVG